MRKERGFVVEPSLKANWRRRSAWADVLIETPVDTTLPTGVTMTARTDVCVANLLARRGREPALSALVKARYGLDLPGTPNAVCNAAHALVWAGPGQWLLIADQKENFAELSELAAVSDQSDGRAALRLSGPHVRDMLAKGCMIDLHPSAFPSGAVAMTSVAHINVHLWRVDEQPRDGNAVFDILVPRSMASSFWSWATASAAEYGRRVIISRCV
jgi:methylglutamate dehydrogenase subunit D